MKLFYSLLLISLVNLVMNLPIRNRKESMLRVPYRFGKREDEFSMLNRINQQINSQKDIQMSRPQVEQFLRFLSQQNRMLLMKKNLDRFKV